MSAADLMCSKIAKFNKFYERQRFSSSSLVLYTALTFSAATYYVNVCLCASIMADRRKLQGEIDRCLKKVIEGVEIFDDIWNKVQSAPNCNIKEKHEADLKKEIKKLQRLRDGIKTWMASSDIKDKKALLEHKKIIENQMERFKVVERETKTKAYSKEGLGAATKIDPREKEKEDITTWLSQSIDGLNVQVDQYESEIEGIIAKKKKLDRDKQDEVDQYRLYVQRHRFHIDKLETIMRLVDNDALQLGQITKVKDDVDYYIVSSHEVDFQENEQLYDDLNLEEASAALGRRLDAMSAHDEHSSDSISDSASVPNSSSPSPSPSLINTHSRDLFEEEARTKLKLNEPNQGTSRSSNSSLSKSMPAAVISATTAKSSAPSVLRQRTVSLTSTSLDQQLHTGPGLGHNYAQAAGNTQSTDKMMAGPADQSRTAPSSSSVNQANLQHPPPSLQPPASSASSMPSIPTAETASSHHSVQQQSISGPPAPRPAASVVMVTTASPSSRSLASLQALAASQIRPEMRQRVNQLQQHQSEAGDQNGRRGMVNGTMDSSAHGTPSQPGLLSPSTGIPSSTGNPAGISDQSGIPLRAPSSVQYPPGANVHPATSYPYGPGAISDRAISDRVIRLTAQLGTAPLGSQPFNRLTAYQLSMLDAASRHMPDPSDSQTLRPMCVAMATGKTYIVDRKYLQNSPVGFHPYYYILPSGQFDTIDFYQKLDEETLFFIFYYMEGTRAQFCAAKALKQRSWRFHTKHNMWFQRQDEPKVLCDDYEQGSYFLFDFENWVKRTYEFFTFEYRYLEDHDLV